MSTMVKMAISTDPHFSEMERRGLTPRGTVLRPGTVYRFLRQYEIKDTENPPPMDRGIFGAELSNDIWQSVAMNGLLVTVALKKVQNPCRVPLE